ncbi:MAG: hypothetical protein RL299_380 [Pseudomonadota bacterium]|jgi:uncharacterized membrane protein YhaH (DUF805 family)
MIQLILQHLKELARFSGREARKPFWIWAMTVIGGAFIAMTAIMTTVMSSTFSKMEQFAAQHPDQVTRTVGPTSYSITVHGNHPELIPDFGALLLNVGVVSAIAILLLAAAVVRRLHDCNRTGAWGLPPAVLLVAGLVGMSRLFEQFDAPGGPPLGLFFGMFLTNLAYLGSLALLVVFLGDRGSLDENRFGPPPT